MFMPIEVIMRGKYMTVEIIEKAVISDKFLESAYTSAMLSEAIRIIEKAEKYDAFPQAICPNLNEFSSRSQTLLVTVSLLFKDHSKMMDFIQSMQH